MRNHQEQIIVLKSINEISPLLTELTNLIFSTGKYPDSLKIAKISAIFKNGNNKLVCNYRPISVLSIINKILEKIIYTRLYDFLNSNNFFYKYQYGFRFKSNTKWSLQLETFIFLIESRWSLNYNYFS